MNNKFDGAEFDALTLKGYSSEAALAARRDMRKDKDFLKVLFDEFYYNEPCKKKILLTEDILDEDALAETIEELALS